MFSRKQNRHKPRSLVTWQINSKRYEVLVLALHSDIFRYAYLACERQSGSGGHSTGDLSSRMEVVGFTQR